ncbi:MAG: hypothetical protein WKG01_31280 [Kofleriaceae bacterium]
MRVSIAPPIASPRNPTTAFATLCTPSTTTPSIRTRRATTMRLSSDGTGT